MLKLLDITCRFGDFFLNHISFEVNQGDYFILLGESGAGKSLILETIAGLRIPDSGHLYLDGEEITRKRIQERNIGFVFQDYAIFPHMTVYENLAYPLQNKHLSRHHKLGVISEIARKMNLQDLLKRSPVSLSGGELQRLALGRTLILSPKILLLDEPLSSLDKRLRDHIRNLLRTIHREGQTIVHVTHDYEEAISLANQIAVVNQGQVIQTGSPEEVFQHPSNEFVANFIGEKNFFPVRCNHFSGNTEALINDRITIKLENKSPAIRGYVLIRHQDVILSTEPLISTARNMFQGIV
ncbi:MAG: ABC transporter ATP-binding protein, partial [Bacteroidales bacterium]|nr:ABC transporter ATP-binding protein [Bacteroidales bacterium]